MQREERRAPCRHKLRNGNKHRRTAYVSETASVTSNVIGSGQKISTVEMTARGKFLLCSVIFEEVTSRLGGLKVLSDIEGWKLWSLFYLLTFEFVSIVWSDIWRYGCRSVLKKYKY